MKSFPEGHLQLRPGRPTMALRRVPAWMLNGMTVTLGLAFTQCLIWAVAGASAAQTAIAAAVCTCLADVVTATDRVARRVLAALIGSTVSAMLFLAVRPYGVVTIPVVALIVFCAMMMLAWGPKAASVSFATILSLVFAMSLPESQVLTWDYLIWGLAGSAIYWVWAVGTAWLLQPTWRTSALAATIDSMAALFETVSRRAFHPGDATLQLEVIAEEAQLAERLQSARDLIFEQAQGPGADMETSVLMRLIDLRALAMAGTFELDFSCTDADAVKELRWFGRVMGEMGQSLQAVAQSIRTGRTSPVDAGLQHSMPALLDAPTQDDPGGRGAMRSRVADLLQSQFELLGAIRAEMSSSAIVRLPCRRTDLRSFIAPDEWRFAAIKSALHLGTPVFRHALRTGVTVGAAYAIANALAFAPHPQWIVLTIVAVMQGSLAQTLARRNARVLGTLAGCVVVSVLTLSSSTTFLSVSFLVAAGVAHAFFGVRYAVTAGAAANMAVLQAHLVAPAAGFGILERFGDTVAGALIGWGATYALPNWERKRLVKALQQANGALRAYAQEATKVRESVGCPRFARQRAYDAIRSLGELRSRSLAEPTSVRVPMPELTSWLFIAYALMSHLSTVRLALVLHGHGEGSGSFVDTMEAVSRALDLALSADLDTPPSAREPDAEYEQALAVVPGLLPRVQRTLDDASRLALQSTLLKAALVRKV